MKVSLPLHKKEQVILQDQDLLSQSLWQTTQLMGCLSSVEVTVLQTPYTLPIFTASTHSRVCRETKCQCKSSFIKESENKKFSVR